MSFKTITNPTDQVSGLQNKSVCFSSIALVGNPNCGKTALFNRLTGSRQKVANYAGVTVERKEGVMTTGSGRRLHIIDLPGIYSLTPLTRDEEVTLKALTAKTDEVSIDLIVFVADATHLQRSLKLILDVIALGTPVVLALNMSDIARKQGQLLDLEVLKQELGIPVVETVAIEQQGIKKLLDVLDEQAAFTPCRPTARDQLKRPAKETVSSVTEAQRISKAVVKKNASVYSLTQKIDSIVLHPFLGLPILVGILFFMFQAVFSWAEVPMTWIETAVDATGSLFRRCYPMASYAVSSLTASLPVSAVSLFFFPKF